MTAQSSSRRRLHLCTGFFLALLLVMRPPLHMAAFAQDDDQQQQDSQQQDDQQQDGQQQSDQQQQGDQQQDDQAPSGAYKLGVIQNATPEGQPLNGQDQDGNPIPEDGTGVNAGGMDNNSSGDN